MNRRALAGLFAAVIWLFAAAGPASASPSGVVVSQVYGGGGNSGATLRNDFIELFNAGASPVALNGWSVQHTSAAGTAWTVTPLTSVTLQPGQYYLVQQAAGGGGSQNLPTPDATGTSLMGAGSGKVALVRTTVGLTVANPSGGSLEDLVGYGSTANGFEGTGPTAAPANTTAVLRNNNGCIDANSNNTDFTVLPPAPRNTATPLAPCDPNQPIVASCPAFNTVVGIAGSSQVSATDFDSIVNFASITGGAVAGITLGSIMPASADGGRATARIEVADSVAQGSYPLTVTFSNNELQNANCAVTVQVIAPPMTLTPIYTIQGTGPTSPLVGQ
ncbi:MAG: lamin tail domain-containing protein, partial [Proteobacteria bacterium]|nr:lamin tail domain-containing protein [Burkholderiales bacterium]